MTFLSSSKTFLSRYKLHILSFIFVLLFTGATTVFAVYPGTQWQPGETLDPGAFDVNCTPGSANCSVEIGGGITIGDAVTDGGANRMLFIDPSGNLADIASDSSRIEIEAEDDITAYLNSDYGGRFRVRDLVSGNNGLAVIPGVNGTLLTIDDGLQTINGFASESVTFGSVGDTGMLIDVANNEIAFQTDGEFNVTGTGVDNDLLTVDFTGQTVYLGDHDGGVGNDTLFIVNDAIQQISLQNDGPVIIQNTVGNLWFSADPSTSLVQMGDLNSTGNSTVFNVDDVNRTIISSVQLLGVGGRAGVSATSAGVEYSDGVGTWSWFADDTSGGRTGIQAGTNIWSWPNSFGNPGEALVDTDGAGTLGWAAVGGGGMSIGDSIGGDVEEGALLFVGGGDVLANDDDLLWVDPTTKTFSFGDLPGGVSANGTLFTLNDDTRNISALVTVAGPTDTTQLLVNTSGSQLKYDTAGSQNSFIGAFSGYSRMSYSDGSFSSLVTTSSLGTSLQFNGIPASSTVGLTDLYASMSWTDPILGSSGIRGAEGELRLFNNDGAGTTAIWYWPTGYGNAGEALVDTDGNGTLGWAAVASGNVTGSGTSPRIPYWSSASALTDDADFTRIAGQGITLWDNSTNNNIFINGGNATTNGSGNIAIGSSSGTSLPAVGSGNDNVLIGKQSGTAILTGGNNVILGTTAGATLTDGSGNVFVGDQAGRFVTNTNQNVMIGFIAGLNSTSAATNTFVGNNAATANTTGDNNVALGSASGITNETGNNNTMIGASSGTTTTSTTGAIALGYLASAATNEFALPDSITNWKIRGSSYTLPAAFPGTNDFVLVSSTTGGMEWKDKDLITSDENLKSNIVDLDTDMLSLLTDVRTVTYTLNDDMHQKTRVGFIAQNLEQYFPELVSEDSRGYKGVYYAQMTPILVEAIRELDLKISDLEEFVTSENSTFKSKLIAWFANIENGITEFIAGTLRARDQLCVGNTCITESQLIELLDDQNVSSSGGSNNLPEDNGGGTEGIIPPVEDGSEELVPNPPIDGEDDAIVEEEPLPDDSSIIEETPDEEISVENEPEPQIESEPEPSSELTPTE